MTTTTTRPVTFTATDNARRVIECRSFPTGTAVAVRLHGTTARIRVRGTLFEQTVNLDSIVAPV